MARTSFITMRSMVGSRVTHRRKTKKCDVFVCFFLFVTLWNYEVCDNGNVTKQYNFQNNYGATA